VEKIEPENDEEESRLITSGLENTLQECKLKVILGV